MGKIDFFHKKKETKKGAFDNNKFVWEKFKDKKYFKVQFVNDIIEDPETSITRNSDHSSPYNIIFFF